MARLDDLLAYCRDHDIHGKYSARHDPPYWRARLVVGLDTHTGTAGTREEALDRAAGVALNMLLDPMPTPGTREHVQWSDRIRGRGRH